MRIRLAVCSLIVALLGAIVATPALAQGTGQGHGQGQGKAKPNGGKKAVRSAEAAAVKYGFAPRPRNHHDVLHAAGLGPAARPGHASARCRPGWKSSSSATAHPPGE